MTDETTGSEIIDALQEAADDPSKQTIQSDGE
jgi:hypothetical protein